MKLIMICGAYRAPTRMGIEANIQKAKEAAINLWQQGYAVFCPHLNTAHFDGLCEDQVWLDGDLEILKRCDAIYVLDNWQSSAGTRNEIALAKQLGKQIIWQSHAQQALDLSSGKG